MLYNKYRPETFDSVVGQDTTVSLIRKAIENENLSQSMLFSGIHGTGKTTFARIIAKELGSSNIDIIEIDAASNSGVDDIRRIVATCKVPPHSSKFKVYIIDEVHMLSNASFNALLKVIEEPPKHCYFILCTTEKNKIIPTILSRCQLHHLNRIRMSDIIKRLEFICNEECIPYDHDGLLFIASKSNGSLRDAISLLEICINSSATIEFISEVFNIPSIDDIYKLVELIVDNNMNDMLMHLHHLFSKGLNDIGIVDTVLEYFRTLFMFKDKKTQTIILMSDDMKTKLEAQFKALGAALIFKAISKLHECRISLTRSYSVRLALEIQLIQLILTRKK